MEQGIKELIKVNELFFDELNPRLPQRLQNIQDEEAVIDYMIRYGNIDELMESIAVNGYSDAEALLVVAKSDSSGYVVIEGNRRLAAVKLLNAPHKAKVRVSTINNISKTAKNIPEEIPVIIYKTREEILDYLGYRHITGVKEWGALEKAKYLEQLYKKHKNEPDVYRTLAKMIGSKQDYVRKLHQALALYNIANDEAYFEENIDEEDISFSFIYTAIMNTSVREFININDDLTADFANIDMDNYKKLFKWLFGKKKVIRDSREIKQIAEVVTSEAAVEILEKTGSLNQAIIHTEGPAKALVTYLNNAKAALAEAYNIRPTVNEEPNECREILKGIKKILDLMDAGLEE